MRNKPLIQANNYGVRFQDAERGIDTYIPVDKEGNWKFPERAPDVEINGYRFIFKGYSAIELRIDQNQIVASRTSVIKNVPFESLLNVNDTDLRSHFDSSQEGPYSTWGGIFAQYEIPAFQKFQFYSTNLKFWKQQLIDGELCNLYKIPCHQCHYLLSEPLELLTSSDDTPQAKQNQLFEINGLDCKMKSLRDVLDFNTFMKGEGPNSSMDGVTKIENNMTVDHDTFVISQSTPLKQNVDIEGIRWIAPGYDLWRGTNGFTGTIENTDQLCIIACCNASIDLIAQSSSLTSQSRAFTRGRFDRLGIFDQNGVEKFSTVGTVPLSEIYFQERRLIELYRIDTEYVVISNIDDPINGMQATVY